MEWFMSRDPWICDAAAGLIAFVKAASQAPTPPELVGRARHLQSLRTSAEDGGRDCGGGNSGGVMD